MGRLKPCFDQPARPEARITIPCGCSKRHPGPLQVCIDPGRAQVLHDNYLIWQADYKTITPTFPPQHTIYIPFVFKEVKVYFPLIFKSFTLYIPIAYKNRSGG
jgi:hypothetical protein